MDVRKRFVWGSGAALLEKSSLMMTELGVWSIMPQDVWRRFLAVGVEDGGFYRKPQGHGIQETLLVSVLLEGTWIDDFKTATIIVDGLDATEKLITMLYGWTFHVVLLGGVSFAGFNLIDPTVIFQEFGKPVVVISRTKPDNVSVKNALYQHFEDWRVRWGIFEKLGDVHEVVSIPGEPPLYLEVIGAELERVSKLIRLTSTCCRVPEPIRVARLIARGLTHKVL